MELLEIFSLNIAYQHVLKIKHKFKQKKRDFGSVNLKEGKNTPKFHSKVQSQGGVTQDSPLKLQSKKKTMKTKKDIGKLLGSHPNPLIYVMGSRHSQESIKPILIFVNG